MLHDAVKADLGGRNVDASQSRRQEPGNNSVRKLPQRVQALAVLSRGKGHATQRSLDARISQPVIAGLICLLRKVQCTSNLFFVVQAKKATGLLHTTKGS